MSYRSTVLALSPDVYLELDEGSGTAVDSSGNGHDGTYTGTTRGGASLVSDGDSSMDFPGGLAPDGVTLPAGGIEAATDFSFVFWFSLDMLPPTEDDTRIIHLWMDWDAPGGGAHPFGYGLHVYANQPELLQQLVFWFVINDIQYDVVGDAGAFYIADGTTYMVGVTYDADGDSIIYIQGSEKGSAPAQGAIGQEPNGLLELPGLSFTGNLWADGRVDDYAYWRNVILTPANMAALYLAGTGYSVVNGTQATLSNINADGVDVGAMSRREGVVLTDAELAALLTTAGVAVTAAPTTKALRRRIANSAHNLNPLA